MPKLLLSCGLQPHREALSFGQCWNGGCLYPILRGEAGAGRRSERQRESGNPRHEAREERVRASVGRGRTRGTSAPPPA